MESEVKIESSLAHCNGYVMSNTLVDLVQSW